MSAAGQDFYDCRYSDPASAALLPVHETPLWEMYREVAHWLPSNANVTDLGCGPGLLMEALWLQANAGDYEGLDFSPVAIEAAHRRIDQLGAEEEASDNKPAGDEDERGMEVKLEVADLRTWEPPANLLNRVFVCLETLEHLDDDLALVERVPAGRRFVFSVPTFDSASHVRVFDSVGAMWRRYEGLLLFRRWTLITAGESERGVVYLCDTIRRADGWGGEAA